MDESDRVLIIDDDEPLCGMLGEYLRNEGFSVQAVHDGRHGIDLVGQHAPDIVVLDITMPGIDGFETLREIRRTSTVPVLMLTARGDDVDRIVGLELGADDYLPKPFNPRELSARLRAVLRRSRATNEVGGEWLSCGDVWLDAGAHRLLRNDEDIELTGAEFRIAERLLRDAGTVVSRDALSEAALGRRLLPFDRSIDTHVSNLRRKLGPGADGNSRIRAIRGRGYLWVRP